jgi:hypothetical protein
MDHSVRRNVWKDVVVGLKFASDTELIEGYPRKQEVVHVEGREVGLRINIVFIT